ncbi:MAG: nickel ABC transporter permease subunit NikC [Brachymonas sp.]|nr:nickel ABC transporter permease subunit NikC [Brachymonas sp.]
MSATTGTGATVAAAPASAPALGADSLPGPRGGWPQAAPPKPDPSDQPGMPFGHKPSLWQSFVAFPLSLKLALVIIAVLVLVGVAAPWLAPYDPLEVDVTQKLQGWSRAHWLGTDYLGRDMLSRLLYGTRISVGVTALVLALVFLAGLVIGGVAGFFGGKVDSLIMRTCDIFMTIPSTVLAVFFVGVLGVGMANVVAALVLSSWPWYARIVRSVVLSVRERDYVLAARASGVPPMRVLIHHILPGVYAQLIVLVTLDIGHTMLHVAGLSFLGLGIAPPTPEWGVMINDARSYIYNQPMLVVLPGLMLFLTVMAFNRVGDALRDMLDPSLMAGGKK